MSDRSNSELWAWALGLFVLCGVLWFAGFPWITRAEEGTAANVQWLVSTIVAVIGLIALVVGIRGYVRSRSVATS